MGEVRHYRSLPALLVIIGAFVLLGLLARLQYRWLSQLSSDERVRMSSALESNVARFCEDFDRELARTWVAFRMEGDALREQNWANFGERYERWIKQSPHPRLVSALFLVSQDGKGGLQAKRFDPSAETFAPCAVPPELESLQQKMEEQRRGLPLPEHFPPHLAIPFLPQVYAETPLLLIPVVPLPEELHRAQPSPPRERPFASTRAFAFNWSEEGPFRNTLSYIVVRLDTE